MNKRDQNLRGEYKLPDKLVISSSSQNVGKKIPTYHELRLLCALLIKHVEEIQGSPTQEEAVQSIISANIHVS